MKLDDVPFIVRDMKKEMPIHTKQSAQVPCSFVRGLPKNLMDWSAHVDNKFLNNHLHEIEEFYHCFPDYHSGAFELYQAKTYARKYDILNHDNSLKHAIEWMKDHPNQSMVRGSSMMIPSSYVTHPAAGGGCTEGSELETASADSTVTSSDDFIQACVVTGTSGQCYDQIAIDCRTASSNPMLLACYNDSSSQPNDLMAVTSEFNTENAYNYKNVTEFTLDTNNNWLAYNHNNAPNVTLGKADGDRKFLSTTYDGTMPDPCPSLFDSSSNIKTLKMTHS